MNWMLAYRALLNDNDFEGIYGDKFLGYGLDFLYAIDATALPKAASLTETKLLSSYSSGVSPT